jgi:hypothetical protein
LAIFKGIENHHWDAIKKWWIAHEKNIWTYHRSFYANI